MMCLSTVIFLLCVWKWEAVDADAINNFYLKGYDPTFDVSEHSQENFAPLDHYSNSVMRGILVDAEFGDGGLYTEDLTGDSGEALKLEQLLKSPIRHNLNHHEQYLTSSSGSPYYHGEQQLNLHLPLLYNGNNQHSWVNQPHFNEFQLGNPLLRGSPLEFPFSKDITIKRKENQEEALRDILENIRELELRHGSLQLPQHQRQLHFPSPFTRKEIESESIQKFVDPSFFKLPNYSIGANHGTLRPTIPNLNPLLPNFSSLNQKFPAIKPSYSSLTHAAETVNRFRVNKDFSRFYGGNVGTRDTIKRSRILAETNENVFGDQPFDLFLRQTDGNENEEREDLASNHRVNQPTTEKEEEQETESESSEEK